MAWWPGGGWTTWVLGYNGPGQTPMVTAWSIPPLLMASVNASVAAYYLVVRLRTRRPRESLSFATLALAVCLYDVCCAFLYDAASPALARPWQLRQTAVLTGGALALVVFVADYTRRPFRAFLAGMSIAYGLVLAAALAGGSRLLLTDIPLVKHAELPFGLSVTYNEVATGPLTALHDLVSLAVFAFVFRAGAGQYRGGERSRAVRLVGAAGLLFVAALNDTALGLGLLRSVYTIEYAFMGMVVLMADSLSQELVKAARVEDALHLSEERFRSVVQQAHDLLTLHDPNGRVLYESPSVERALGYGPGGLIGRGAFELVHPDDLPVARGAFEMVAGRQASATPAEYRVRHADGRWLWVETLGRNLLDNPAVGGIVLTSRDITERKRAEGEICRKLEELTVLNAVAQVAVQAEDEETLIAQATEVIREALFPDDCGILLVDEAARVLRYTSPYSASFGGRRRDPIRLDVGVTGKVAVTGRSLRVDDVSAYPDYLERLPGMRSEICVPLTIGPHVIGVINAESSRPAAFTESDERVLGALAGQLATAIGRLRAAAAHRASEERFRRLAEAAFEGIGLTEEGRVVDANPRLAEMLGYQVPEMLGRHVMEFVAPSSAELIAGYLREGKDEPYEHLAIRKDGSIFPVETQGKPLPLSGGRMRVAAVRDITERKRAEQRIQRQLERLAALYAIDAAIASRQELPATLELLLAQTLAQLLVDAADVLLFEPASALLVHAASRGFRSNTVEQTRLRPGECFAGQAVAERRRIAIEDLAGDPGGLRRTALRTGESFRAYFGEPILAQDHVHGVLEVWCRDPMAPDEEWLSYLETLAGQLAIAIDNRSLFASLQRSNAELARAYDTTLEGWSRALELRDRETQGHSERVVELTLTLARTMGVSEGALVHVRRGALLHDIGKMGMPDSILLKPGPLDEEEWVVMRRHPQLAHDLLAPIAFLGEALDIPHCHHERWDGTGYPGGLAGEAIPLAARIFAVVDAWDALRFARPYRAAWPDEQVHAWLRQEAGKRFDPAVVEAFLGVEPGGQACLVASS